jgi:uncharacterized protein YggU (UPF0235/DUF167 family)
MSEDNIVTVEKYNDFLRLLVRAVPNALYKGNKKAEDALIRLLAQCFSDGVEFGRDGKVEVAL